MKLFQRTPSRDTGTIQRGLEQLCDELAVNLGEKLESVLAYGPFVRLGNLDSEQDSVNLLMVIKDATCQTLDQMSDAIERAQHSFPLTTMTLTREDLRSSCDVFPIKFHSMRRHHQLLAGDDVLSGLTISDDHLRLRCEQQLKNLLLRLRAAYLHRSRTARQILGTLVSANENLILDLEACLFIRSGVVPEAESDVAVTFGDEFGLDASIVQEVITLRGRQDAPSIDEMKTVFDRFMSFVHDAAAAIDRMEVGS